MNKYFLCLLKFPIFHFISFLWYLMELDEMGTREHFIIKLGKKLLILSFTFPRISDDLRGKITCPAVLLEQALLSGCIYVYTHVYWWPVILEQGVLDIPTCPALLARQEGSRQGLGSVCRVTFLIWPALCNGTLFLQTLFIASPCSFYSLPHLCP